MITVKEVVLSMNTIESTKKWQEDEALRRFRLISPILDESLDPAKRLQIRKEVAEKNDVTTRSLYRYEAAYRSGGFAGLRGQPILRVQLLIQFQQGSEVGSCQCPEFHSVEPPCMFCQFPGPPIRPAKSMSAVW